MTAFAAPYPCSVLPDLSFHVIGISHHTARVDERERFALTHGETVALLREQQEAGRSALLLSTCNRCEYYWSGSEDGEAWLRRLAQTRGAAPYTVFTRHDGEAAVRHLFIVAAGLDSQVLGETEILGQVRRAYDAARAAGTTTRDMDLILSGALAAGRRVRRETVLGRHPASVSSAAVDLMAEQWGIIGSRGVVVLGAGEAAEGILRALSERGATNIALLNRHPERAQVLAEAWGATAGDLIQLEQKLEAADLLVVATASAHPVVTSAELARVVARRGNRELFVVDLGVPRNVDPAARAMAAVQLFDLDDLQRLCCPAAGTAPAALADAERVIDDELARLGLSLRSRVVAPRLAELHRIGVEMAEQESAWALAQLESLSDRQREIVRQMADRLIRRVLYPVSRTLRTEQDPAGNVIPGEVKNLGSSFREPPS
ncbi:MAG TPA: glutamyl-tRNA reductase [Gemmatimonadales bacterium]|nr:glutamyl-tRNA reductase [Gemmatimonadales bacterium]